MAAGAPRRPAGGIPRRPGWGADLQEVAGALDEALTAAAAREAELAAGEARLRALLEGMPQQVWTATRAGGVDYVNRTAREHLGAAAEAVLRDGWRGVVHPDGATTVRVLLRRDARGFVAQVVDSGPGIPAAPTSPTSLGMQLVRSLNRQLRGTLELGSAPGGGGQATLRVPLNLPTPPTSEWPAAAPPPGAG